MASVAQDDGSKKDIPLLLLSLAVLVGGIYGFYHFEGQTLLLYRVLGLLAVAGLSIFIAYLSTPGRTIVGYLQGARTEVRKVVWPTRQETVRTTIIIAIMVALVGIFLWLLDLLISLGVNAVYGM